MARRRCHKEEVLPAYPGSKIRIDFFVEFTHQRFRDT